MTEEPLTEAEQKAAEELIRRSRWMHGTWKGRLMSMYLGLLLFLEGVIWSVMDAVRAARMRLTARMHD